MACTPRELMRWLSELIAKLYPLQRISPGEPNAGYADYQLSQGLARVRWSALPDRVIALVRLKRLEVSLEFEAQVDAVTRASFIKQFELHTLRGGG